MNSASYFKQTGVYFRKISRISIREKVWVFVAFAFVISLILTAVIGSDMYLDYESTNSGLFTLASACIWIGIFNTIQIVCKEHDIIRSDYRQGTKLSSYITAHILWQAVLCFVQSLVIFFITYTFGFFGDKTLDGVFMNAYIELFITVFLLTFGSAVMGLMVSSFSTTPTTAMKIMPFVLILQLIMSGVLFELSGAAESVAYITFSKWGMSAFGSISDLNNIQHRLVQNLPEMADIIANEFPAQEIYKHNADTLLSSWIWCIGITAVCGVISVISLKVKNRNK